MEKEFDVYGIGNPLIDLLRQVEEEKLIQLGMDKGIMQLIEYERREFILEIIKPKTISLGGSCANTIIALASFGLKTSYSGGVGDDEFGKQFVQGLQELNVHPALSIKNLPTGSSIILITPDFERTQNTFLGACQEFTTENVDDEIIKKSKMLYFTGYMWDTDNQKEALKHAIDIAKDSSTQLIFDVADPFAVNRSRNDFIKLIKNDIDFVFANYEEASTLTNKMELNDIISEFSNLVQNGVVKNGQYGSVIFSGNEKHEIESFKVNTLDTTGAGDMYAAGMIYGLSKNYDLSKSGRIASFTAAKIVEQIGARLDYSIKSKIDSI